MRLVAATDAAAPASARDGSGPAVSTTACQALYVKLPARPAPRWRGRRSAGPRSRSRNGCLRSGLASARVRTRCARCREVLATRALWALAARSAAGVEELRDVSREQKALTHWTFLYVGNRRVSPRGGWQSRRQKSSSWSKSRKAIRISPLSPACRIVTFVPSARPSFSWSARVSASIGAAALRGRRRFAGALAEALDVPHRQALRDDAVGDRVGVGDREQRAGVAGRDLPAASSARLCSGRPVSRMRVGDMAAALADDAGDVGVRIAVVGAELGVARRLPRAR